MGSLIDTANTERLGFNIYQEGKLIKQRVF